MDRVIQFDIKVEMDMCDGTHGSGDGSYWVAIARIRPGVRVERSGETPAEAVAKLAERLPYYAEDFEEV